MSFRQNVSKLLAIGVLALSAQSAAALFVASSSDEFGRNSLVVDSTSGLTWLNLDVTAGLSFNAVAGLLETDARFEDFRFASLDEVAALFFSAGFSVDIPSGDLSDPDRLALNSSFAKAFVGVRSKGTETFRGYTGEPGFAIDPANGVYSLQVAGVGVRSGARFAATAFTDEVSYFSPLGYAGVGSWLIYDPGFDSLDAMSRVATLSAVTPIPEPSTYALMALGLLVVAAVIRRRRGLAAVHGR